MYDKQPQAPAALPVDVHFDMETGDPDDACTLLILLAHPAYRLRSVTVTPGTDEQVGMVKKILHHCGQPEIPVGSPRPGYEKNCVGRFYFNWLGDIQPAAPDGPASEIIQQTLRQFPHTQLLTGAPLKAYQGIAGNVAVTRWVAQGGFAGDNIVPPNLRLPKFEGKTTCATYNFNGDPLTAEQMLANEQIAEKWLVSKNVCHGMIYDAEFHQALESNRGRNAGWDLLLEGMGRYLAKNPNGKKFHDPLAAAVMVRPQICTFRQVEMYRARGEWGARPSDQSNTWISIEANRQAFIEFLTENG